MSDTESENPTVEEASPPEQDGEKEKQLHMTRESAKILGINLPENPSDVEKEKVMVPRDPINSPEAAVQSDLFVSKVRWKRDLEISDKDKEAYLRAILHEATFTLDMQFFGGRCTLTFRARSNHEQDMCINALDVLAKERGQINLLSANTELQQFSLAIMLIKVDGKDVEGAVTIPVDMKMEEAVKLLHAQMPRIKGYGETKWGVYSQAMMMFHEKQALMQEESLNGDFWPPAD